jgi:hypothetical protein
MKRILSAVCFIVLRLCSATSLLAQGIITGTISGTVADPTGAVIQGAMVTASDTSTGVKATATTGKDGTFSFKDLQVGTYTITITGTGFAGTTLKGVKVDANREQALGVEKLKTGGTVDVVEVSAATNMLETSEAQVSTTFDAEQLSNLPTSGGFDELALLIPGVANTHGNGFSNTNGAGLSVNGERGRSNNFELDGQSNNDNSVAGPQAFFGNDEALSEIQIITNNFGAQYGRNMGSVINYITKSGTNSIHGSAIYRYSGNFTSSHETGVSKGPQFGFCAPGEDTTDGCTATSVPRYVDNTFGGTLGVPIIKDKLWAFGSTYFVRFYEFGALSSSGSSLFPDAAGLTALAAQFPNSPAIATLQALSPYAAPTGNPRQLPYTNAAGIANFGCTSNGCPETFTTPSGAPITVNFAPFGRQVPDVTTDQEDLGRIDWQATPKDRIYVRYFYQKNPTAPDGATANGGFVNVRDAVHSVGADLTHIFGPHWVDQLRYSFQQSVLAFDGGGFPTCTITSFTACPSSVGVGKLPGDPLYAHSAGASASGLGLPNNLPQGRIVKVGQVQDNATWTFRHHAITFGGEFDYTNSPNTFLPNASGTFTFDTFQHFLDGGCATACTLGLTAGNPVIPFKEDDVALYFQDDWKVTPSLTLNLGLRWEFFQQALNLLHNKSVAQQTGPAPFWDTTLPLSETTFPSTPNYYKNYEPRIGFAFNPTFAKRMVIRGGYAINVDPGFYNINLNVASSAPLVNAGTIYCTTSITCLPTGGATYGNVAPQDIKYLPTGGNPGERNQTNVTPNFRQPEGQTFSLGVEYQVKNSAVLEVRYTGNHTSGNFQSIDANPYVQSVANDFPSYVPSICTAATSTLANGADIGHEFCGKTNVRTRANTAFSIYNSLQASLTTRRFHGITSTFAYTYSRTIDNASEIFPTFGAGNTEAFSQSPFDHNYAERNVSGDSYPNVASASLTYLFPALNRGNSLVKKFTNGWQVNTIWLYNSGQPYTDYDYYESSSPVANFGGTAPDGTPLQADPRTFLSYSDSKESSAFGSSVDFARPIVSNKKAPVGTIGIWTTTTNDANVISAPYLADYATGAPITPSQVHFIANNKLAAQILGNPFPGSGRNILRGSTYNNVDASVFKNTKITERVTFRFEADAFNVLNRAFFNTPDNFIGDYPYGSFNNNLYTYPGGSNVGVGTGLRNMTFGGKILF